MRGQQYIKFWKSTF